tara:strand:+ start:783 stop:938 length:156 start_codon:yes stop_codon:yes gene_type:complete
MRDGYQCEQCKNTTRPDEFSCNCLCINCGPCDGIDCKHAKEQDVPNKLEDK